MQGTDIDRPIFIVGPHRSGTTLLYQILGRHPDVAYFNRYNKRFPGVPLLAHALTRLGSDDEPLEAQSIWDRFRKGDDDVLTAADAGPEVARWYRRLVSRVIRLRGASRFLSKYPRLSLRLDWVDAVFPGAFFVHMARDWRAVVHSTVSRKVKREKRGGGWFGVYVPGWRALEDLPHDVAAARVYRIVTEALEDAAPRFEGRLFRVSYEDLCRDPSETVRRLAGELGLPWTPEFASGVPRELESANTKWRKGLDPARLESIRAEAPDFFGRYEEEEGEEAPGGALRNPAPA